MEPEDEVELTRVSGRFAAEPILAALRANGIEARMRGEAAAELYGLTLDGLGETTILVRASQAAAARALLRAADLGELRLPDAPDDNRKTE